MSRTQRIALTATGLLLATTALGCATTAGQEQYLDHLNHSVDAGAATTPDVAFAFGLDGMGDQGEARADRRD